MNRNKRIIQSLAYSICLTALMTSIWYGQKMTRAQKTDYEGVRVTEWYPLAEAADRLEELYKGTVITYEDVMLVWSGDMQLNAKGNHYLPKRRSFIMPIDETLKQSPVMDSQLLCKVIDAYNSQTDGARFQMTESRWGMHIVPAQVRDEDGEYVNANSILDTYITVTVARRTPEEHFRAICEAVTIANDAGIILKPNVSWLNQYYASKEMRLHKMLTDIDKERISFTWGIREVQQAREAIIDLLEGSSSTMTWRLLCEPDKSCVFNLLSPTRIIVDSYGQTRRKRLSHDRY